MVTGDHPSTAEGIAREVGITGAGRTATGAELDELGDEKLDMLLDDVAEFGAQVRLPPNLQIEHRRSSS